MKGFKFALVGAAALALAACGGQSDDALTDNVDANAAQTDELNGLADNAALEAETEALGNQAQQLEAEPVVNQSEELANGLNTEESEVEDNVQGM